jgi:BASS family bile acid:Na+ symporter
MTFLALAFAWSVRAMIFALGLRSTPADLLYLWRRPELLVRSLLAMYVAVPAAAIVLVRLLHLPRETSVAILVLAVAAGAPLVPRRLLDAGGDPPYVLSLAVTTSLLAIVSVPISLWLLRVAFAESPGVGPAIVAWVLAKSFLLPFLFGLALRTAWPALASRLVEPVTTAANTVLAGCILVLLVVSIARVVEDGWRSFLALGALTVSALAAGHLLGGPKREDRVSLAVLCATRHVGLVMVIAFTVPSRPAVAVVCAYVLAAMVVSTPYVVWQRRQAARERSLAVSAAGPSTTP